MSNSAVPTLLIQSNLQKLSPAGLTAQDLVERIQKNLGVAWESLRDGLCDGILFGSADTEVTGIVTTFTPTLAVLKQAVARGRNTIVCREAPLYSRGALHTGMDRDGDTPPDQLTSHDPVCRAKRDYISRNGLVIILFRDNWDARRTDGQLQGLTKALGWEQFHAGAKTGAAIFSASNIYFEIPKAPLGSLVSALQEKLKIRSMRVIGNKSSMVQTVGLRHGVLQVAHVERILQEVPTDVIVAGDAVEWEAVPYLQDLVSAGKAKGLILLGDEASEEPGSGEVAIWLRDIISEVPIEWIPAGEPFWALPSPEK